MLRLDRGLAIAENNLPRLGEPGMLPNGLCTGSEQPQIAFLHSGELTALGGREQSGFRALVQKIDHPSEHIGGVNDALDGSEIDTKWRRVTLPGVIQCEILAERHSEQQGMGRFVGQRLDHRQPVTNFIGIADHRTPQEDRGRTPKNIRSRPAGGQNNLVAKGVDLSRKIRTRPPKKATSLADEASHSLDLSDGSNLQVERQV